jgi:hypothetical protein
MAINGYGNLAKINSKNAFKKMINYIPGLLEMNASPGAAWVTLDKTIRESTHDTIIL